jgi:hypothetical protein
MGEVRIHYVSIGDDEPEVQDSADLSFEAYGIVLRRPSDDPRR